MPWETLQELSLEELSAAWDDYLAFADVRRAAVERELEAAKRGR